MIDVAIRFRGQEGKVLRYEPLGSGMCDTLIAAGGKEFWVASHELRRVDGVRIPSRQERRRDADKEALTSLREIRRQHVEDFLKPWPGLEHGKALLGQMIDGAIADIEERRPVLRQD